MFPWLQTGLFVALIASVAGEPTVIVGDTRITALSPTLLRIEPRGPTGFENRSTFNVIGRENFSGIEIQVLNTSATGTWLGTAAYHLHIPTSNSPPPRQCAPQLGTDGEGVTRLPKYPNGTNVDTAAECCNLCLAEADCVAWTFSPKNADIDCWPFSAVNRAVPHKDRVFGMMQPAAGPIGIVTKPDGTVLWNGANTGPSGTVATNLLHWPSPTTATAYAFEDRPRFVVPPWGPTPIPVGTTVPPELLATNGYDFTNEVDGDTYIFLLGDSLDDWWTSRQEFLELTGPTPILPDVGYGIWYTWYIAYTEARAKDEIGNWTEIGLPLDVWGLDMNWREVGSGSAQSVNACRDQTNNDSSCRDHYYNHPNTSLLPGLESPGNEWFEWIKEQNLSTYFNDHPFPVDNQTTPKEVGFRYGGISEWIARGLTWFWFDHNWAFTLPGPRMPFDTKDDYEGLSGQVWGSHVYYESTRVAQQEHNIDTRPIALSRDNGPNWRTPDPEGQTLKGAGSPAHHRFPVWWTGDGVPLMASVESMVNEAVHDFRPFVHSDCGGHGNRDTSCPGSITGAPPENVPCATPNNASLLRWTAHCVLGTITRYHQGDHRFWLRDNATQNTARSYLTMRHKLAPSLIAAGRTVQQEGFPLTARCDLLWPEHPEANDPTQYIHINSTLVAPLDVEPVDVITNTRSVWIPPGEWIDGWTGTDITGPQTMTVTQPADRIPMWHRRGSLLILDGTPNGLRIVNQDWTELTIEAFPASGFAHHARTLYEQEGSLLGDAASTRVELATDESGLVALTVSDSNASRSWVVRLHLHADQRFVASVDANSQLVNVTHLFPASGCDGGLTDDYFPFSGAGFRPACQGGPIAEFRIAKSSNGCRIEGTIVPASRGSTTRTKARDSLESRST